ncbi:MULTISPECIES: N-formylglutamate amidohydrolase [Sphingobacterium]|uniref:N-formylglutamate amidohydrolase n=1 Tax=Sphingobacterium TaxID=28453 RepID=UPI0013DCA930|nr:MULTISPECIES: N-formylglutamate amidohydrolase [unclassified Sphingobacterium]
MSLQVSYHVQTVDSPFWSFAIHDGHHIDQDLLPYLLLNSKQRLREEDPYTALIAELPINQFVVGTSRFQLDLNRSVEQSVYLRPDQAWGLTVWKDNFPVTFLEILYKKHRDTYRIIERNIQTTIQKYGFFVVLDVHSYNVKRESISQAIDEEANPQINLGTYYNDLKWRILTENFLTAIQNQKLYGGSIDVRENIKFKGGYLNQFINSRFGDKGCVFSVEFRKDFMNEWTGEPDVQRIAGCKQLLINTVQTLKDYFAYER